MKITPKIRLKTKVFDSWWPLRLGSVSKKTKTTVTIMWVDGESWKYDRAHLQFLRLL